MRWTVVTNCDRFFITKCDTVYYKLRQVLQSAMNLLQSAMIITNCDSRDAILSCLFFRIFFPFIFFDGKFRLFIYSDSNSYLDTEISIVSLRFGVLEITLMGSCFGVIFSFVYTVFALFTFHVLVAYGGPEGLYLIFFFRKRLYQNRLFAFKVGRYFDRQNSTPSRCKQ